MADCPFCTRIEYGEFDAGDAFAVTFPPLKPVCPGHRLFVPKTHVADALENPLVTAMAMRYAAEWAAREGIGACNLITSRGPEAGQSVYHLHVHLVPRLRHDGLPLPWTGQEDRQPAFGELDEHMRLIDASGHDLWQMAAWLPKDREGDVCEWMAAHGIEVYRMWQARETRKTS